MSARIFGVGVGVFLVAFIWLIALISCAANSKAMGADGAIMPTLIATILTLILIFFPRESMEASDVSTVEYQITDYYFIPRILLVVIVCVFLLFSIICFIANTIKTPIRARTVNGNIIKTVN